MMLAPVLVGALFAAVPASIASPTPTAAIHPQSAAAATDSHAEETPPGSPASEHGKEEQANVSETLIHHAGDVHYRSYLLAGRRFLDVGLSKHLVFFVVAAVVVLLWVRLALRNYRAGFPGKLASTVEILLVFIRDEIAEQNIGHEGRRFVPLLASFFFFILTAALLGLMPFVATSTGNISVTMGLAFVSFLAQQYAGISKYGLIHHFKNIVPPGLPKALLPIMIPVEIMGMFTKPCALMIRLFANMLAGHMVIATLLLLIPVTAQIGMMLGIFMVPVALMLALFINFLEILVAFIQAYIFTLLSAIFIGMYAHPSH